MASTQSSNPRGIREGWVLDTACDRSDLPYATPQQNSQNLIRGTEI